MAHLVFLAMWLRRLWSELIQNSSFFLSSGEAFVDVAVEDDNTDLLRSRIRLLLQGALPNEVVCMAAWQDLHFRLACQDLHSMSRLNFGGLGGRWKASDVCKHWCSTWGIVQKNCAKSLIRQCHAKTTVVMFPSSRATQGILLSAHDKNQIRPMP